MNAMEIAVEGSRTETVQRNEVVTVGGTRSIAVGANEVISIGSDRTISVNGNEVVSVGAARGAHLTCLPGVTAPAPAVTDTSTPVTAPADMLTYQGLSSGPNPRRLPLEDTAWPSTR